jgi:hypothetical protein
MPQAALPLAQVVDRALAFDADRRHPDAAAMKAEVDQLVAAGARATALGSPPTAGIVMASVAPGANDRIPEIQLSAEVSSERPVVNALRELLKHLEKTMLARIQYGTGHKESARRFETAYRQAVTAIELGQGAVAWNVTPYAFVAEEDVVWEPKAPLDSIPYRMFADGLRLVSLHEGLEVEELETLVQIWMRDPAREIAPEDDLVTLFWDADFAHVGHEQLDTYAEGDQEARANFERDRQKVVALASFDTSFQLEECWHGRARMPRESLEAQQQGVVIALDAESVSRAASMQQPGASGVRPRLDVDEHVRATLAARMAVDIADVGERFVAATARALLAPGSLEGAGGILGPLRAAAKNLATTSVADAVGFVCAICRAVEELAPPDQREALTGRVADALVSRETLELMFAGGAAEFADDLAAILRYLHAEHLPVVLKVLPAVADAKLLGVLLAYVERCAVGHEAELAELFDAAGVELALALVRILVALGTPAARQALVHASRSEHPIVRIEALGNLEGVSSDKLRLELKRLLEDAELTVRMATLDAIRTHRVKPAGPALVLRIRSGTFDGLPAEEKRRALEVLWTLMPSRAEDVCIEVLSDGRVVTTEAHERTRELGAELLAQYGTSQSALEALDSASRGRWRNSDRVRSAASKGLATFEKRASQAPPPPTASVPPKRMP